MAFGMAGIDSQIVRGDGFYKLCEEDRNRVSDAIREISKLPIVWIDNQGEGISVPKIHAIAKSMALSGGIDLVAVDYIQIIKPPPARYEAKYLEIEAISQGLLSIATQLNCAVLALSQYSRGGDLKGTQALRADPHTIIELSVLEKATDPDRADIIEVDITKQRNGRTGKESVAFLGKFGLFTEISGASESGAFGRAGF